MSELIKATGPNTLIVMVRLRTLSIFGLIFIGAFLFSTVQSITANNSGFSLSQFPVIHAWGIEGEPELGNGFDVWANVSYDDILNDDDPELRNVTVEVNGPNMTLSNLLTHNGTYYTGSVPAFPIDGTFIVRTGSEPTFPIDGTFRVRIRSYDMANETRTSGPVYIDYVSEPIPEIDTSVTIPVVVGSSFGLMAVVIGLAVYYDKRVSLSERDSLLENEAG